MLKQSIASLFDQRFLQWLNRRMPAKQSQKLTSKNIFIFPSWFGFSYLLFVLLLFLLGTNYQNNVIVLLSYLLASFFITAMLHAFYNLSGLTVSSQLSEKAHAYQPFSIEVRLTTDKSRHGLSLAYPDQASVEVNAFDEESRVQVPLYFEKRGRHTLGRLKISSEYGFGLFHCWTRIDFGSKVTIYPKPLRVMKAIPLHSVNDDGDHEESQISPQRGYDEFYELSSYQRGESLAHVAWKQVAKGREWQTKRYQQAQGQPQWLDFQQIPVHGVEKKLQALSFLVSQCHKQGQVFGLKLDKVTIAPNSGTEHLHQCLTELALFRGGER